MLEKLSYALHGRPSLLRPLTSSSSATEFIHRAVEDGIGSNLSSLAVIT